MCVIGVSGGRPWTRTALVVCAVLGSWTAVGCRKPEEPARPRSNEPLNVLLITLDTTRADCLGCCGHPVVKTPSLDRLAEEGVLFTQCITCVPITLPSHASILMGTYPFIHGSRLNGRRVADEGNVTLGEVLKESGYATGAEVAAFVLDAAWGLDQGFDTYRASKASSAEGAGGGLGAEPGVISSVPADDVCDRALEWLDKRGSERFFLWVHFWDPHHPYEPPEPFKSQYEDPYLGEIAFMDSQIGRLTARLDALGLERQTLVVVVGDHGEAFKQHQEGTHMYFVYDSTLHVPLLFRCPGRIPSGRRVAGQVRTVDVVPTILDTLGMEPKPDAQGVSLMPLTSGAVDDLELAAYAESMSPHLELGYAQLRCLRVGEWKYIHAPKPELYKVAEDPGERSNLGGDRPDLVSDLREELRSLIAESAVAVPAGESGPLDPGTVDRLASLGYLAGVAKGVIDDELKGFDELAGVDPKDRIGVRNQVHLARAYVSEGERAKAEEVLQSLVAEGADHPAVYVELAKLRREDGQLEEAVALYRKLLELGCQESATRFWLGRVLCELGELDEGVEHLERVVREVPGYPDAHACLALARARQGHWEAAVDGFKRALALNPGHEGARLGLSGVLRAHGGAREALAVLRAGVRHAPHSMKLANNLAWCLATSPEPDLRDGAAAVRLAEGIRDRLETADPEVLDTLAAAYAEAGRFPEAIAAAREALELAGGEGSSNLVDQIKARLAQYEGGQPHREDR